METKEGTPKTLREAAQRARRKITLKPEEDGARIIEKTMNDLLRNKVQPLVFVLEKTPYYEELKEFLRSMDIDMRGTL